MTDHAELKRLVTQGSLPPIVSTLIAEIDRLRDSHQQVCENYNKVSYASEERGKQIDQLRADNEALIKSQGAEMFLTLTSEISALRKDADRLRWLRQYEFDIGSYHGVHEHNAAAWFEHISDEDVDSMIAEEAQFAKESGHE